jgi:FkbM family methyltransferase
MSHFLNTLDQIVHSDSVGMMEGFRRHGQWQIRKLLKLFPCSLPIAGSQLYVERPGGVAALVNAMGEYDYNNMELLRLVMSRGNSTFFDIGANIGAYTLIASEIPAASVVSIEPHPYTFSLLKQNIELNLRSNVICLNIAVSDTDGPVLFSDYSESCVNRVLKPEETEPQSFRVQCQRIDEVCAGLKTRPDFVKIDVEGHELHVLEGFGKRIGETKMFFIERGERAEVRNLLQTAEFSGPWFFHCKQKRMRKNKQAREEDSVYVGSQYLPELRELGIETS